MIKKKELDSSRIERMIIQQMIINTDFLLRISKVYDQNCLKMPYTNTLAELCIDYYNEYKKAPGKNIQDMYENIVRIDPDQKELIKSFLISINKELQQQQEDDNDTLFNTDYNLKLATDHLTHIRLARLKEDLENAIAGKDYAKAEALTKGFKSVSHQIKKSRDALSDRQFAIESFESDKQEILFTLPGDIGRMMGPIRRGGYYIVQAQTGVGKSWMLSWISMHAAMTGNQVALTPLEMKDKQANLRIQHMLSGKCLYKELDDFVYVPIWDCLHNQTGECVRGHDSIATEVQQEKQDTKFKKPDNKQKKYKIPTSRQFDQYKTHSVCTACKGKSPISSAIGFKVSTWYKKIKVDYATPDGAVDYMNKIDSLSQIRAGIHINDFPRGKLGTEDYDAYLHNLYHYEGKEIDVAIPDYANEMKKKTNDPKIAIDLIHDGLKSMAQERNIAVVSANQENDDGLLYGSRYIGHIIDGGIRISQTPSQKARGYYVVNTLKQRFGKGAKGQDLYVIQCLEMGKPVLDTFWDISED